MKVGTSSIGCSAFSRRMTRSIFSSASACRPYPLLASAVVVPQRSIWSSRARAAAARSSSVASRVARTVERMPPPSAAISA